MNTSRPKLKQTRRHSWFCKSFDSDGETSAETISAHETGKLCQRRNIETSSPLWNSKFIHRSERANGSKTDLIQQVSLAPDSVNQFAKVSDKKNKKEENNNKLFGKEYTDELRKVEQLDEVIEENSTTDDRLMQPAQNNKEHRKVGTMLDGMSVVSDGTRLNFQESKLGDKLAEDTTVKHLAENQVLLNYQTSRLIHRRATVDYSSSGKPSVMNFQAMDYSRRTAYSSLGESEKRALERIKDICRDYILYRLKRKNLIHRVILKREQSKERWLIHEILFIEKELEHLYQSNFCDISKQIGITLRSEDVLRKVFFELSGEIITTDKKSKPSGWSSKSKRNYLRPPLSSSVAVQVEITWGRIFALLGVAGGLAVECVQQGHADFVNYLIEYIGDFSRVEGILPWITSQGGWEVLKKFTFEGPENSTTPDPCYFIELTTVAKRSLGGISGGLIHTGPNFSQQLCTEGCLKKNKTMTWVLACHLSSDWISFLPLSRTDLHRLNIKVTKANSVTELWYMKLNSHTRFIQSFEIACVQKNTPTLSHIRLLTIG